VKLCCAGLGIGQGKLALRGWLGHNAGKFSPFVFLSFSFLFFQIEFEYK